MIPKTSSIRPWRSWKCPAPGCEFAAVKPMPHPCPLNPKTPRQQWVKSRIRAYTPKLPPSNHDRQPTEPLPVVVS